MTLEYIKYNDNQHQKMANALRFLAIDAIEVASSGHPGMPMGMADVVTVLFRKHLRFCAQYPRWPDRDRFILSAGHGSMLLYGLLYLCGYEDITIDEIKNFRQLGSVCAGHPEFKLSKGIETTTGPLGQGIANAVGMALAERILAARFNDIVNHYTYFIAGDGCLMEGICQEAISLAGHLRLGKLIGLFDDNGISIDGTISLSSSENQLMRFQAAGWHIQQINGHDAKAIDIAIKQAKSDPHPSLIACRTVIGMGSPNKGGTSKAHGSPLGNKEINLARETLNWQSSPFDIPNSILKAWREVGQRGLQEWKFWQQVYQTHPHKKEFDRRQRGDLPDNFDTLVKELRHNIIVNQPYIASRTSFQHCLDYLADSIPELIGGSADLTTSNNTKAKSHKIINSENFSGHYIHYGIREHAMAGVMNGMTLHGGIIPYGGTFLVFSDYCRPPIRLAALMGIRTIFVFSHDSIGLGEDGPTHQPIEHLSNLRSIPNLKVYRPADALETLECWQAILKDCNPSVLVLSRQKIAPTGRQDSFNLSIGGAYILHDNNNIDLCLLASGSEVEVVSRAASHLEQQGFHTRVISVPCLDIFLARPLSEQTKILGESPRIIVEAAIQQSWDCLIRPQDLFIGMHGFGKSGTSSQLFSHFGITVEAIVDAATSQLSV